MKPEAPGLQAEIMEFFTDPITPPPVRGRVSTLYLLRREIQDCLIGTVVEEAVFLAQPQRYRLFATAMVVFAGIDLLAKFAATDPSLGMHQRFIRFLTAYGVANEGGTLMTDEEATAVASYRNALLHSFGLYHEADGGRVVQLRFVDTPRPRPVVTDDGGAFTLSINDLIAMFLSSVKNYQAELEGNAELQAAFSAAFPKYGMLHMEAI